MSTRPADRLVVAAVALVAILGSGYAMVGAVAAEPWVRLALRLEASPAPLDMPEDVRARLGERLASRDSDTCGWDMPRSHVTIALELLRRTASTEPSEAKRESAARIAEAAVRDGLLCNAADGNLWYLFALLQYRASGDWEKAQPYLLTSALLSPFEKDLLLKRAELVAVALAAPGVSLDLDIERDLRNAVVLSRTESAAAILASLRKAGRGELAEGLVADLSDRQKEALAKGGARASSTFGRTVRYRHFEYRPFGEERP